MMKTERQLQTRIANEFKNDGWMVEHLSPPSCAGWPDLIAIKDRQVRLVEIKDFDQINPGRKMSALFQRSQPPYYLKCLKAGTPVTVLGCLDGSTLGFVVDSEIKVTDFFELGRDEYLEKHCEKRF